MKTKFEFDTGSENFDFSEYEIYKNAPALARCLGDITNQLRQWDKYDERELIPTEEIRDEICDIIQDNNINMADLGY